MKVLATFISEVIFDKKPPSEVAEQVKLFRQSFKPQYCYSESGFTEKLQEMLQALNCSLGRSETDLTS